ncbi:MAG TPA: SHOCT domain-containing protein [Baekduia sp.]|nr:SHOCT domain-containing protein [Baekduia sp.]
MGLFTRKTRRAPATIFINGREIDEQTRARMQEIGLDPDGFALQMRALGRMYGQDGVPQPTPPATASEALTERLLKLKRLRESGKLTAEEFATAKSQLRN